MFFKLKDTNEKDVVIDSYELREALKELAERSDRNDEPARAAQLRRAQTALMRVDVDCQICGKRGGH